MKLKDFFNFGEVFGYLFKPKKGENFNTRAMHFINRLAILIFLVGVIYIVIKYYI